MDSPKRARLKDGRNILSRIASRLLPRTRTADPPAVFHVTHPKAGSQWLHKILLAAVPERVVAPDAFQHQFLEQPLRPGKVYPTLYVTKQQFEGRPVPPVWRRFVVIRDLRDTLVSAYFSLRHSHPDVGNPVLWDYRAALGQRGAEDGLLYLLDRWLPESAAIQWSWWETGEPLIRYEDLLNDDLAILSRVLLRGCRLGLPARRLAHIVAANCFERLTGRPRGQEDRSAHERKGIAGDWRNHFTPRVTRAFKDRYGPLLVATGYERGLDW